MNLDDHKRKKVLQIVKNDVDFLSGLGLMDYSLLLGIETLREEDMFNTLNI